MRKPTPLKLGVIGAGRRSLLAIMAHQPQEGTEIVAVCDPSPAARADFAEKTGAHLREYSDHCGLLEDPEIAAVFVFSPDHLHAAHASEALEAGKAVYLEKPMAIDPEGCDRILRAAEKSGKLLFLGHNMRHFPVIQKMKELVDSGIIGAVKAVWCRHFISYGGDAYFRDWHADRTRTTGLLLQKGSHDIDIIHWLASSATARVSAMGKLAVYGSLPRRMDGGGNAEWSLENWPPTALRDLNPTIDVEDLSMVLMELESGALASYQQCHFTPDSWRNYTVIGTQGRVENLGDLPGNASVRLWTRRTDAFSPPDQEYVIPGSAGGHGGADQPIIAEFLECLRSGKAPGISPLAARQAVATGYWATESLRLGGQPMPVMPFQL